jgi:hypothetical protein
MTGYASDVEALNQPPTFRERYTGPDPRQKAERARALGCYGLDRFVEHFSSWPESSLRDRAIHEVVDGVTWPHSAFSVVKKIDVSEACS